MDKYLVQFYYIKTDKRGTEVVYSTKHCRRPRLTSEYKYLSEMLDQDLISGFGYKKSKYI